MSEIAKVVETSTAGGQNNAYVIGNEQLSRPFHYYNWADFLSLFYNAIPQITSYYHFRFDMGHPGTVFVREFVDAEEKEVKIIKPDIIIDQNGLPSEIIPSGLSEERKQYLFEHIRQFCDERYKDVTCPEPRGKKRPHPDNGETSGNKSKRLCSHCRQPGHTKTRKGVTTCPVLLQECNREQ
jgi:hypothetical protein